MIMLINARHSLAQYPAAFWWLWFGQLCGRSGTLVPAFLVLYVQRSHYAADKITSIIIALFGVGLVLAGVFGGAFAEWMGPKRLIIILQPTAIIVAISMVLVDSVWVFGSLTLIAGFLSILDRPAAATIILNCVGRDKFSEAYGIYLMGFNIGMTFAPVLSGIVIDQSPYLIFILWAGSAVAFFLCIMKVPVQPVEERQTDGHFVHNLLAPYRNITVVWFLILTFIVAVVYLQMNSTLPLHMVEEGLNGTSIGVILAINAVLSIILLPLVPKIAKNWHQVTPLVLASLLVGLGFGLNLFAHSAFGFILALIIWTCGEVLWAPMSASFLMRQATDELVSSYQGSFFLAWNLALMIGAPLGIWLAGTIGFTGLWLCSFLLSLVAVVGFIVLRNHVPP